MASVWDFSEAMWRGVKELKTKNEDHQRLALICKIFIKIIIIKKTRKLPYSLFCRLVSAPFFSSNSIAAFLFGHRELTARCYKIKQQEEIKYPENQYKKKKQKFRESYSVKSTAVLSICRFSVDDRASFGTTKLGEKLYMYM